MIASTFLAVFVVPVFFVVFQWLAEFRPFGRRTAPDVPAPHAHAPDREAVAPLP